MRYRAVHISIYVANSAVLGFFGYVLSGLFR